MLTGYRGGQAVSLADVTLVVPSSDMQQIENCHTALMHLYMQAMCEIVRESQPVSRDREPASSARS